MDDVKLDEAALEAAGRAAAAKHYSDRFSKPADDPHIQMNVDAAWHIHAADSVVAIRAYLAALRPVTDEAVEAVYRALKSRVIDNDTNIRRLAADALRAALSATVPGVVEGWQPIETAPKDRPIIVGRGDKQAAEGLGYYPGYSCEARWSEEHSAFVFVGERMGVMPVAEPSHWQELPVPPALTGGEQ